MENDTTEFHQRKSNRFTMILHRKVILFAAFACVINTQQHIVDGALSQQDEGGYRKNQLRLL